MYSSALPYSSFHLLGVGVDIFPSCTVLSRSLVADGVGAVEPRPRITPGQSLGRPPLRPLARRLSRFGMTSSPSSLSNLLLRLGL